MARNINLRIALPAVLIAWAGAAAAQALDTSTSDFAVQGYAPQICAIQAGQVAEGSPVNFLGLNGTTLQIDRLVDPTTLATRGASVEVDFPAICSYPHRITLESQNNGLWRRSAGVGTAPVNFADGVPYTAQIEWSDVNRRLEADTTTRTTRTLTSSVDQAAEGFVKLRLSILPGASNLRNGSPLVAGVYEDTLRVTVEPQ